MKKLITLWCLIFSLSSLTSQDLSYKARLFTDISAFSRSPELRTVDPLPPSHYQENGQEFDHMQKGLPLNPVKEKAMMTNKQESLFINDPVVILNNFEGVSNVNNMPNPDTEGDVGLNHYMQMVKSSFAIWDKEGNLLYGPADNKTIWNSIAGPWHDNTWTDPVVIYDPIADRWVASAMVYDLYVEYWEMIAVSATPDPLGAWNCYALHFMGMPDYPKLGVWPDGYYLTINDYTLTPGISIFEGAGLLVFNRDELINGNPDPTILHFQTDAPNQSFLSDPASFLPADLDGPLPPEGMPNFLVTVRDDDWGYEYDHIWLWKCVVDWQDTSNCVFEEVTKIQTEPFDARWDMGSGWVPMPNTTTKLHGLGHFMMYRLQYRNFGEYQSLVCNHTVNIGNDQAGIRWYELRYNDSEWSIYQHGTFAPDDDSRWMGSIAMDKDGNIGLGYSVSGTTTYPSIRLSGRNYSDLGGAMTFTESVVVTGGGNQVSNVRWGDYSMLAVDPADDMTFWYTQEFLPSTGWNTWRTRVASFQLQRNLEANPDSLVFMTYEECSEGLTATWKNTSSYPVTITDIEQQGIFDFGAPWNIDPWNINLPTTLQPGDSVMFRIIVEFSTDNISGLLTDTLDIVTDYKTHHLPLFLNEDLIISTAEIVADPFPEIQVRPNPFKDQSNIVVDVKKAGMLEISLHAMSSEKIDLLQPNETVSPGTYTYRCGSSLAGGVYIIRIKFNESMIIKRIIKI